MALGSLIEWSYRRRHEVVLRSPTSSNCANYLSRMGLGQALVDHGYSNPLPHVTSNPLGTLSELRRFEGEQDLDDLVTCLIGLYRAAGGEAHEPLYAALYETAVNVIEHSEAGGGWVALQFYRSTDQVVVATADCGRGMKASLGTRTDRQAVSQGARLHETSTGQPGRGRGIPSIISLTKRYCGQVVFVTGTVTAIFTRGNSTPKTTVQRASVPGTLVETTIRRRRG